MPDPVLVGVEARIAELVDARRPVLERLVRQAVDRELAALIDAELASRNGAVDATRDAPGAGTKLCKDCGETKPLSEFEKHRAQCRDCRRTGQRRRTRERRATKAAGEEPHPAPRSVREGRPGEHRRMTDAFFREQRREMIEHAATTTEERDDRTFVVRHLASQYAPRPPPCFASVAAKLPVLQTDGRVVRTKPSTLGRRPSASRSAASRSQRSRRSRCRATVR